MYLDLLLPLILFFLCMLGISWFAGSGAPFVTTKYNKITPLLKAAGVKKNKIFYELGSGDGRIVFAAAKLGAISIGIEESILRVWYSKYQAKKQKLFNTKFIHGDIFKRDYKKADVIFIYLLPVAVIRLEKKLRDELPKKATVITQTYHFKKWQPKQKIDDFWVYQK